MQKTIFPMNKLDIILSLNNIPEDLIKVIDYVKDKKAEIVTREILIDTIKFLTIDVKLPRFKEDILYEDIEIRTLIPRGLCFIFANGDYVHTLYGHPKFGNEGDYLNNINNIVINNCKKVFRSKENGECAHWGAFVYSDEIYEIYGSKNVHLVVRSSNVDDDLKLYTDVRYEFALKMAMLINKYPKTLAVEYLVQTKNTLCGEGCFCDSQHLVKYDDTRMYFFAVTNKRSNSSDPITVVSPLHIDNLIMQFGLDKVAETIYTESIDQVKSAENYFETKENSEGAVVNCIDSNSNTIYVYKHKNFDYIFKRALREQMRKFATTQKILKRFSQLHIAHPNYNQMVDWAIKFNAYYRQGCDNTTRETFFNNWITQTQLFDQIDENTKIEWVNIHNTYEKAYGTLEIIMLVGMPGSGKSFIARSIKKILEHKNKKVVHLEQDMFYHLGPKNASKHYEKAIENAIKDDNLEYLILAKSNHNDVVRKKTYETLSKCKRNINRTYVLLSTNDQNLIETANLCIERVLNRGNAHASLYGKTREEIESIIFGVFVNQWKKLDENELTYDVINLEINQSKLDVLNSFRTQAETLGLGNFLITDSDIFNIFESIKLEDENMIKLKNNKNKTKQNTQKNT